MHSSHLKKLIVAVLMLGALALTVTACGGDDGGGQKGGTLKVLANGDVDNIDPGIAYYQFSYMVNYATVRPLYSWEPDETKTPTPDLAEDQPEVSDDGRTVTVKIRDGVRFGPPVNREVTTKDVKYAIERGATKNVANGYVGAYFGSLEGIKAFQDGKAKEITGIEAPDNSTIVFKLAEPTGVIAVPQALSLPLSAPVPEEYAKEFDTKTPSTYGQHQVATGPYMIEADKSGKLTGYKPGKQIVLVRNPNWDKDTDYREANLDRIEIDEGLDLTVASRQILNGRDAVSGDYAAPPVPVLKQALSTRRDQLEFTPSGGNRYVALNTKMKPFDDVNVRRAVLAGIDREALVLTRGGKAIGDVATHFIPPGMPGFEEAGGPEPGFDFLRNSRGDPEVAAKYFKRAGFESGKYEGDEELLMIGDAEEPAGKTAEAVQAQLQKLGFKLNFRQVPHDTMYTRFCNVPKANVAICPNVGWLKDFNDPQSLLDPTFNGKNIVPVNNSNWPQLDDPKVNAAMKKAATLTGAEERAKAWGDIDKMITSLAPAVPWIWDKNVNLRSTNVDGVVNQFNGSWDLSFTSLK